MYWGILQRKIFFELLRAFLMSLLALTSILLLAGIVAEASQRGLSPSQILVAIPLIIPSTLPYTIPSTTLFAVCVVYGRLSHDNEIIAIRAAGINVLRIVLPGVLLGLLTSVGTLLLYAHVIPETQYMLRARFLKDAEEFFYSMLKNDRTINHPKLGYAIWVRQVQGRRLIDPTFKRRDARGEFDLIARAREADLLFDNNNNRVVVRMRHGEVFNVPTNAHAFFEYQEWEEKMPDSPYENQRSKRRAREMTWLQLLEQTGTLVEDRDENQAQLTQASNDLKHGGLSRQAVERVESLRYQRIVINGEIRAVNIELHMRPTIALGCLCFALVGCPVGIWFSKRDYLSAFITCFLPIVTIYYPLLLGGHSLARTGRIPPLVGLGGADLVALIVSLILLRRLLKN